jgi:hypothetical protein
MTSKYELFDWNETVLAKLRELWDEGLSTLEIAKRLGTTKNAVGGKTRRLRLPARSPNEERRGRAWSEDEDNILRTGVKNRRGAPRKRLARYSYSTASQRPPRFRLFTSLICGACRCRMRKAIATDAAGSWVTAGRGWRALPTGCAVRAIAATIWNAASFTEWSKRHEPRRTAGVSGRA